MQTLVGLLGLVVTVYGNFSSTSLGKKDLESLQKLLPDDYDKSLPPFLDSKPSKPMVIYFHMKAREVQEVDEQHMEITVEWYVRLFWTDNRLIAPSKELYPNKFNADPRLLDYIWLPAAFLEHAREITSPTLLTKPAFISIDSQKNISYSAGQITRLSCPMDFSAYPFDTQTCYVTFEDYRFSADYIIYQWQKPISTGQMSKHPQFSFEFHAVQPPGAVHAGDLYSAISVEIILSRSISNHLMNTYFPSTMLVVVSWLSFLVPPSQVPGRMVLIITTLLTLMSMFSAVRNEGPQVSYAKAIDQWMLTCLFFVFLVLIEFAVVLYLLNKESSNIIKVKPLSSVSSSQKNQNSHTKYTSRANFLEKWSWVILLVSFMGFIIIYWSYWYKL